jgi:uncharacterized damage-inducible protein DinB
MADQTMVDLYGRIPGRVRHAVAGLDGDQLAWAPMPGANSIGWLVWHLTRVQDHHVSELLGEQQLYVRDGWAPRFGRQPDPQDTGYGHSADEVANVRPGSADLLVEYYEAVHARTVEFISGLADADLERVVDRRWDPPVTMRVRLVSVADDDLEHAAQAAYVRGLLNVEENARGDAV